MDNDKDLTDAEFVAEIERLVEEHDRQVKKFDEQVRTLGIIVMIAVVSFAAMIIFS